MPLLTLYLNLESSTTGDPVLVSAIPNLGVTVSTVIPTFDTGQYFTGADTYALTGTLPTGLSFNTGNGRITGTPTVIGLFTGYIVTATNTHGSTPSGTFQILVSDVFVGGGDEKKRKHKFFKFYRGL